MIIVNDTFIYDSRTAVDFLCSLGMDRVDIEEMIEFLSEQYSTRTVKFWENEAKEWEHESAREYELRNSLICEVQNLADELATGKGGTKAQYADRFLNLCEFYA
jgi:hypothetical protein